MSEDDVEATPAVARPVGPACDTEAEDGVAGTASDTSPDAGVAGTASDPVPEPVAVDEPRFGNWLGSVWLFTGLRYGLFFVLWAILYLVGVKGMHGLLAPLLALVLSVPLSFVLLAKPRARVARQIELRVDARRADRGKLDAELDPDAGQRELDD